MHDCFILDINECKTENGGCTQTCNNIAGSYYCSCIIGYELANDNHTCNGMYSYSYIWYEPFSYSGVNKT